MPQEHAMHEAQTDTGAMAEIAMIDGEARISDRRIQKALGYSRIDHLNRLIKARKDELEDYGRIFLFKGENSGRGRKKQIYYLNEHQATALCFWAETPKARAARRLIVEVFTAWRTGRELPPAPQADPFESNARRAATTAAHVASVSDGRDLARGATHLPIWTNGRRPRWWSNLPLRALLTELHRQATLREALAEAEHRFGTRCTSIQSIQRYWARLDHVCGPIPHAALPSPSGPRRLH
jgi:hypothetical protein